MFWYEIKRRPSRIKSYQLNPMHGKECKLVYLLSDELNLIFFPLLGILNVNVLC